MVRDQRLGDPNALRTVCPKDVRVPAAAFPGGRDPQCVQRLSRDRLAVGLFDSGVRVGGLRHGAEPIERSIARKLLCERL